MKSNPYLEIIIAAIIWGTSGIFVKTLNLPATTISFFRFFIPTLIIVVFFIIKGIQPFKKGNKLMLLASVLNAIRMWLYFVGYILVAINNAVIIVYTWPIFATIFSCLFLKEHISKRNSLLLVISFIGVCFMYFNKEISLSSKEFIGMTAILVSAMIYAITVIIFKKESEKYTKSEILFYQNLVGTIIFIPFIFINKPLPTFDQTSTAIIYATIIGVISFGLFFSGLKKIKASTASHLAYIEVISAIILGVILLKETLAWNTLVGGTLIVISTLLLTKEAISVTD